MPFRRIVVDGKTWAVMPSGRVTANEHDEFALVFVAGVGPGRVVRVTRYSPHGTRSRERSLLELSDAQLEQLFGWSQPSDTSPEADYSK